MTIPGDNPLAYQGVKASNPPNLILAQRAPTAQDISQDLGSFWLNEATNTMYVLVDISAGAATWDAFGGGAAGVDTLTGNSGGAISPAGGNINILGSAGVTVSGAGSTLTVALTGGSTAIDSFVPDAGTNPVVPTALGAVTMAGTANQITTTGGLNTLTFSLPTAITAPGSLTTTTTLDATTTVTGGTGVSATTGDITAVAGNIVATAGNITATVGSVSAGTTVTGGTGVVATTGDVTSTAGNLVATVGNLSLPGAGAHAEIEGGAATDFIGTATLTAGTVTVAHTGITAADRIMVTRSDINGSTALGVFEVVKTPATNFVINARNPADATIQTNDVSVVEYVIVRQL